jgi:proteasome lid subunit RPN8/RPN11
VGGFGIARKDDLLYLEDILLVKQRCTPISVRFEDESVADFFDAQIDRGLRPEQFARVWVHTHPGRSPFPSSTDEETFARVFGACDWSVMFILAEYGETYARLAFRAGPGGALEIPVEVDYRPPFPASDLEAWEREYQAHVAIHEPLRPSPVEPQRVEHHEREREYAQDAAWDDWWEIERRYWEEEAMLYE